MSSAVGQELRHLVGKCIYDQLQVYHEKKRWGNKHPSLCKHSDLFLVTHKSQPNHTPDTKVTYWSIWKGLHSRTQNVAPKWRLDIEKWSKVRGLCSSASTLIVHPEEKPVCPFQGTCKVSFSKPTQGLPSKVFLTLTPTSIHLSATLIFWCIHQFYSSFYIVFLKIIFIFPYWIAAHLGFIPLYPWHIAWKLICYDSP